MITIEKDNISVTIKAEGLLISSSDEDNREIDVINKIIQKLQSVQETLKEHYGHDDRC